MKREEQKVSVKGPIKKKTAEKPANEQQKGNSYAEERATELPEKEASVAAEMKNRQS